MVECPQCTSQRTWRDGLRSTNYGDVQRYLCRKCGFRFSEGVGQAFYSSSGRGSRCQIGAKPQPRLVENLVTVEPPKEGLAGATGNANALGSLVDYSWWMRKQGYASSTVTRRTRLLKTLFNHGAELLNPSQ